MSANDELSQRPDPAAFHRAALEAAAAGDLQRADTLLRHGLRASNAVGLLNDLGAIRGRMGMHRDAETMMRSALVAEPGMWMARTNLAAFATRVAPSVSDGVLVSFCNSETATLGLLDPESFRFETVDLMGVLPAQGVTGLAQAGQRVYAVLHNLRADDGAVTSRCALLVLDRRDLAIVAQHPLELGLDVHSIAYMGGCLYAVSTGTDEVLELTMDGDQLASERVFWRPDPALDRDDHHHLNAIFARDGELLVSGFGRRAAGERWSTARGGFVRSITGDRTVADGINQPHSVAVVDGLVAYCESPLRAVRTVGGRSLLDLPGYARGICSTKHDLFVATSQGRQCSRSTGEINNAAEPGVAAGHCTVVRYPEGRSAPSAAIELGVHAAEIYDLLTWSARG